ncbi:MAG: ABC1 kinase family protein [Campylobacterales bacterium]
MRALLVFRFLITLYLLIKQKERVLFFRPYSPTRLKEVILTLGASFIKLSQVLSTRSDFFSAEYIDELSSLFDEVPPMSSKEFEAVFQKAFNDNEPFLEFDKNPIASASIGEVHKARLKSGDVVAVKLLRKDIEKVIKKDLFLIRFYNSIFRPFFSFRTKNSIDALIDEFSVMILKEIDFDNELLNLKKFTSKYRFEGIRFPTPYEEFSSKDALVMSFEEGFRIDDRTKLEGLGIDFRAVIDRLIVFYTEQMLVEGYFHADPHPGNLLINKEGELILLDFGMVKSVKNNTRVAMIELIKSANERDFELFAIAAKRLGVIDEDADSEDIAELSANMFDIFSNDSLNSKSMQKLAFDLLGSFKDIPFKLPQDAIYVMRASSIIEGIGTKYIENFNGIKDILPTLKRYIPIALQEDGLYIKNLKRELKNFPITLSRLSSIINATYQGETVVRVSRSDINALGVRLTKLLAPKMSAIFLVALALYFKEYDTTLSGVLVGFAIFLFLFRGRA